MDRKTIYNIMTAVAAFAVMSLASCVKDDLYDTPHPDKGAVLVRIDWKGSIPEVVQDEYTLNIDGEEQTTGINTTEVVKLSEPGTHTVLVYNRPAGIIIENGVASVGEAVRSRTAERVIRALPGYFFTGRQEITVARDDTLRVHLPMEQRNRDLRVELTVANGNSELIESVTGTLRGIAGAFGLQEQKVTDSEASTVLSFMRSDDKFTANARLLGFTGGKPAFTLEIRFTDGRTQTVESGNFAETVKGFGDNMTETFVLTNKLNPPADTGMTATIENWKSGNNGEDIDIH